MVFFFYTSWEKPQNGQKGVVNLVPTISRVNNNMFRIRDCTVFHSPLENFQARKTRKQELRVDDGLP
jgi:hypothetical protein